MNFHIQDFINDENMVFVGDYDGCDGWVALQGANIVSVLLVQSDEPGDYQSMPAHVLEMIPSAAFSYPVSVLQQIVEDYKDIEFSNMQDKLDEVRAFFFRDAIDRHEQEHYASLINTVQLYMEKLRG